MLSGKFNVIPCFHSWTESSFVFIFASTPDLYLDLRTSFHISTSPTPSDNPTFPTFRNLRRSRLIIPSRDCYFDITDIRLTNPVGFRSPSRLGLFSDFSDRLDQGIGLFLLSESSASDPSSFRSLWSFRCLGFSDHSGVGLGPWHFPPFGVFSHRLLALQHFPLLGSFCRPIRDFLGTFPLLLFSLGILFQPVAFSLRLSFYFRRLPYFILDLFLDLLPALRAFTYSFLFFPYCPSAFFFASQSSLPSGVTWHQSCCHFRTSTISG
ncbi:hypothetical protein FB451DRAFT_338583 [Mycena latifolia]|nr:hypothetical protein FB451DRAFT_338583 [Mycena latifolia]